MEPVGAKQTCERSVAKSKLRNMEFYGDRDSKKFINV